MDSIDYFMKYINSIEPIYETEDLFSLPFYEFEDRFNSLYRHWNLNKDYISSYVSHISNVDESEYKRRFEKSLQQYRDYYNELEDDAKKDIESPEDVFYDGAAFDYASDKAISDIGYFPEYLRLSTISFALSLVENLLGNLSDELSKELNINIELDKREIPYINKYILWFSRGCGLDITIDKSMNKSLDAIRAVRNRFIHRIDRDLPDDIKKVISEMVSNMIEGENSITNEFVYTSLLKLASLVKKIELSYITFYEKRHGLQ